MNKMLGFSVQSINTARCPEHILYRECFGRIVGLDGSIKTAGEVMSLLEANGEQPSFDLGILKLAIEYLIIHQETTLGVNISAKSIHNEQSWVEFKDAIRDNFQVASRLIIEITERTPITILSGVPERMAELKDMGCRLAIDDFGVGYSTAEVLFCVWPDIVKIDSIFLQKATSGERAKGIFKRLVELAYAIAPVVVVEGVETNEQLEIAERSGASHVQGYLLSEPTLRPIFIR